MPITEAEAAPSFAPLDTARLRLRALQPADRSELARLAGDWQVARNLARVPHPYTVDDADSWIAHARRSLRAGSEIALAVERRSDGAFLGCVGIELAVHLRAGALGYWIGRPYWGSGYAREATRALVEFAFDTLRLQRLEATVLRHNRRSMRVLEALGFDIDRDDQIDFPARGGRKPVTRYVLLRRPTAASDPVAVRPMILVVAVALVDADGRVLLAQRPAGKAMAGLWEFPGGKVEPGEPPESALIRELREELDVDTEESCLAPLTFASHSYDSFHLLMPLYVCRVWRGKPNGKEGQRLAWVRPARLADYPMPPADAPLIPVLRDLL
ncbi:MAG: bifunctional GNAT family N-acetyltransferase/(deoxy)nucleoside triphosphate pyrophosphohydrolase [Alphaproteobacteria bacterium]|nr:bifunctional GNAT family N-acetyltransferase/(deoxy)nucleoside triphosphate pyrophosphohydrolase [Alphaproteobacteria bacterium]